MKKPVLAAAVVTAIVLLMAPWIFGAFAQQRVAADVERLAAEGAIDAEVVDYARGWTTSTATIELRVPQAAIDQAQLQQTDLPSELAPVLAWLSEPMRLLVTMRHGPILLGGGVQIGLVASTVHLDPATPGYQVLLDELGIPYLFELRTVTGFGGRSDFVNELPAFALERDDLTLIFSGSDTVGHYDTGSRRLEAQGGATQLHVEANGSTFDLEQLRFNTDSTRYNDLLRLGFAEASVARVSTAGRGDSFALDDLDVRFDIDLEEDGKHATMTSSYSFARLSDGPDIDLSELAVNVTARRVDIDALTAYYTGMQVAGVQNDPSAPLSLDVEDALYELMVSSPQIELMPMSLNWNGEPLNASVRVDVDGASLPPRSNFNVLVLALGGVVAVDASVELSDALANMIATRGMAFQLRRSTAADGIFMTEDEIETIAQAQAAVALAGLTAQGMLTSANGGYAATARFAQGELSINGKPIPLGLR